MQQYEYDCLVRVENDKYAPQKHITIIASNTHEAKSIAEAQGYRVYHAYSKGRAY